MGRKNSILLAILCAVVGLCIYMQNSGIAPFGAKDTSREPSGNENFDEEDGSFANSKTHRRVPGKIEVKDSRLKSIYKADVLTITPDQLDDYLRSKNRNSASLISAFSSTEDPAFLTELLLKFPADQGALSAVLLWTEDPEEREKASSLLREQFPDSALPGLVAIDDPALSGDQKLELAIELLDGKSDLGLESLSDRREDYEQVLTLVSDPIKAWAYSLVIGSKASSTQLQIISKAIELAKLANTSPDIETKESGSIIAANLVYRLIEDSGNGVNPHQKIKFTLKEKSLLETLDPTINFGTEGMTIRDRLNEISDQQAKLDIEFKAYSDFFPSANPAQVDKYVELWYLEGEQAALDYIHTEAK